MRKFLEFGELNPNPSKNQMKEMIILIPDDGGGAPPSVSVALRQSWPIGDDKRNAKLIYINREGLIVSWW